MSSKIKDRRTDGKPAVVFVQPPMPHDTANETAAANTAVHHSGTMLPRAPIAGNHARHHVSRKTQA